MCWRSRGGVSKLKGGSVSRPAYGRPIRLVNHPLQTAARRRPPQSREDPRGRRGRVRRAAGSRRRSRTSRAARASAWAPSTATSRRRTRSSARSPAAHFERLAGIVEAACEERRRRLGGAVGRALALRRDDVRRRRAVRDHRRPAGRRRDRRRRPGAPARRDRPAHRWRPGARHDPRGCDRAGRRDDHVRLRPCRGGAARRRADGRAPLPHDRARRAARPVTWPQRLLSVAFIAAGHAALPAPGVLRADHAGLPARAPRARADQRRGGDRRRARRGVSRRRAGRRASGSSRC